jgi:acetolactate synthase I/II/III large subunit
MIMTRSKTGAELFVECLLNRKVEYIFGIPGAKIDALFDALIGTPIKLILCRHEQNACFMAQCYGRLTGKPGVVLVTSGPGVSNLITGLLTATSEGDPIVAIGGNVPRFMHLKKSHQACDNVKLTSGATKLSVEVPTIENIPELVENAFKVAQAPRSGAVFLSVPQDILIETTTLEASSFISHISKTNADAQSIHLAAEALNKASHPSILLGLEASRPENAEVIRKLVEKTKIPVISTYQAAGVISRDLLDYFVGRVGLFKNQPGDKILEKSDVILAIGFSAIEYDPETWNHNSKGKKIIHCDYNMADVHNDYKPYIELLGEIHKNIEALHDKITIPKTSQVAQEVKQLQQDLKDTMGKGLYMNRMPIHPLKFISELRHFLNDDAIVTCDIGSHYMWMARYFFTYQPHHLLFSNGQQTLGVALPWAMAAKLINKDKLVISISGDGGFLFSAQELETAVREKLHFIHFIWVDKSYDMVREQQELKYHRHTAVDFGSIDVIKFAESFGAHGFKVKKPEQIIPILKEAIKLEGPVLIEVPIDYSDNKSLFMTLQNLDN